ncbi:hypothetical protein T05_8739, partial [Trichinella murrelli]
LPAQQSGGDFAFFLVFKGEEIRAFHFKNSILKEITVIRVF